jgi:hypothetical protein
MSKNRKFPPLLWAVSAFLSIEADLSAATARHDFGFSRTNPAFGMRADLCLVPLIVENAAHVNRKSPWLLMGVESLAQETPALKRPSCACVLPTVGQPAIEARGTALRPGWRRIDPKAFEFSRMFSGPLPRLLPRPPVDWGGWGIHPEDSPVARDERQEMISLPQGSRLSMKGLERGMILSSSICRENRR